MRSIGGWVPVAAPLLALALVGCGWEELDALVPGAGGPSDAGAGVPEDAGPGGDAVMDATFDDATSSDALADDGPSDTDAADVDTSSSNPCTTGSAPVRQWTFDSDTEGWTLQVNGGVVAGVNWIGTVGNPSPGALDVTVTSPPADASTPNGGWVEYQATPLGDLSGRVISAWVWLESGPTPNLKVFVKTGSQFTWADNGTVHLEPHVWTCVSLAVSSPSYTNGPEYDPQNVVRMGFEMLAPAPFQVYVDSVSYQ